jgi:hypothetical protein
MSRVVGEWPMRRLSPIFITTSDRSHCVIQSGGLRTREVSSSFRRLGLIAHTYASIGLELGSTITAQHIGECPALMFVCLLMMLV